MLMLLSAQLRRFGEMFTSTPDGATSTLYGGGEGREREAAEKRRRREGHEGDGMGRRTKMN